MTDTITLINYTKPKITIIYNKFYQSTAEYLMQLIGMRQDIRAVLCSEEKYKYLQSSFSSDEKIIFIGTANIKYMRKNITDRFGRFGMFYGWLGNRVVISVDTDFVSKKDRDAFDEYAAQCKEKLKKALIYTREETVAYAFAPIGSILTANIIGDVLFNAINSVTSNLKEERYHLLVVEFLLNGLDEFLR